MKEAIQKYRCKTCKQETEDKKVYLKGDCATCRLLKVKTQYMKRKVTSLTKFSKHQELKVLLKKEKKIDTDSSDFSDDISEDDNDADLDYVAETPQTKCKTSFLKKKTPSKITPTAFPKSKSPLTQKKTSSKIRPTPFPRSKSPLTQKKKENPPKKVEIDTVDVENANRDTEESSSESEKEIAAKLKMTVKKDWKGTENFFPKNKKFTDYVPPEFDEPQKELWQNLVLKRKAEIERNLKSVEKVPYSGRLRLKCPCPVKKI